MGPGGYSATNPSSSSGLGSVKELRDNGSNWLDYQSQMEKVLGAKGLWRHVVGTAIAPELYAMVNGVPILKDGTPATDEEVEANEDKNIEHEKRDYLAQAHDPFDHFNKARNESNESNVGNGNVGCGESRCHVNGHDTYPGCRKSAFEYEAAGG